MIMVGEPGTGKSMLARSMTEFLPKDSLEDVLVYRNVEDENEPRVRTVPAGRGSAIISERKAQIRIQRERTNRTLLFVVMVIGAAPSTGSIADWRYNDAYFWLISTDFWIFFLRTRLTAGDESNIPKLLIREVETMIRHSLMQPVH